MYKRQAQEAEEGEHSGNDDRDDGEAAGTLYLGQRRAGRDGADYRLPELGLLRLFGRAQGLGVGNGRLGLCRSLSLRLCQRVKEEHGTEAPQLAFRIGGVLGFKGFLRLGELSPVFRGRGQFPGSQVTGDEALGAEFTYQDGLASGEMAWYRL